MKGQTGIWIDKKKAIIVHIQGKRLITKILEAQADYRLRITGRGSSEDRFGFGYQTFRDKETEKIRLGRMHFMEGIIELLEPDFHLAIFGPHYEKNELRDILHQNPIFANKPICLVPTGATITTQQFIELLHDFYGQPMIN